MRNQHKRRKFFIGLTLNSLGALFSTFAVMFVIARCFGQVAIPAIQMMASIAFIPIVTLIIGIVGWFCVANNGE
jgi:hypothetical protein